MNKLGLRKRELVLLTTILLLSCAGLLANRLLFSSPAVVVEVAVIDEQSNRTVLETFDLEKDCTYSITTPPLSGSADQGLNLLIIQNGEAWISEANCPNQDCVRQGRIRRSGEMLVCLPHRVTVSIVGEK